MNIHSQKTVRERPKAIFMIWIVVAQIAALAAVPTRGVAQVPTFNTIIATPTGSQPWQPPRPAAVGDFNGDGKLDALIVDGTASARFMYGNGNGTFSRFDINAEQMTTGNMVNLPASLVQYMPKSIDGYILIKAADVNGDGKLDAICATTVHINWGPYSLVTVLINTGNDANGVPQFSTTNYFLGFYDVRSLTAGDLNGDDKPEFIVGSAYAGLYIYRNNGDGAFTAGQVASIMPNAGGPAVGAGVITDVNGDGKSDFVVTSGQANATDVFLGNGDGTLQAPSIVSPAASCIAVADLNNDGNPDLIEGLGNGSVSVYLGNGNGTFGSPANFPSGATSSPSGFFISDVNGDGNLDVAASLPSIAKVAILTGNGDGTLSSPYLYGAMPNIVDVTLADFTGDGKPDIASVSANGYGGQNFGVLTNTTPFPPPVQLFFTDALTGPDSPNLATIPAGKYSYTASGLQRTQSNHNEDRPMVFTGANAYLTVPNFTADLTVTLANNDLLFYGLGQGDSDPGYHSEPSHAFYFRVHRNFGGSNSIDAAVRSTTGSFLAGGSIGTYVAGSTITLRIVRAGDIITMSVVGGGSATFSLSAHQAALGLTNSNTRVFFGNSNVGSIFSNLAIYEALPPPANQAPVAVAGADQSFSCVVGSANVTLNGSGSNDPDGDPLSYSWSLGASVVSTSASFTTSLGNGTHTFKLTVSDGVHQSSDEVTVTVATDQTPPVLTVPDNVVVVANTSGGYAGSIGTATAEDACGLPVTITSDAPAIFPLGATTVQYSAVDVAGNVSTGSQTVTVNPYTIIVDIKPGSSTNVVNFKNKGVIPVAVLTTSSFDATTLDVASLRFGPGGATEAHGKGHPEDVDHDGDIDLMLHFDTQASGLTNNDGSARLVGTTLSGIPVSGSDVLNVGRLGKDGSATGEELTESESDFPKEFNLGQNYPNPFNPSTTIQYDVPEGTYVRLTVFDVLGREVAHLVDGQRNEGRYSVTFDASGLKSGMYFYRLETPAFRQTKRFILLK